MLCALALFSLFEGAQEGTVRKSSDALCREVLLESWLWTRLLYEARTFDAEIGSRPAFVICRTPKSGGVELAAEDNKVDPDRVGNMRRGVLHAVPLPHVINVGSHWL